MTAFLGGQELAIVLVIVLVLFGGAQLPKLARNLGKAQKEFREGLEQGSSDSDDTSEGSSNSRSQTSTTDRPEKAES